MRSPAASGYGAAPPTVDLSLSAPALAAVSSVASGSTVDTARSAMNACRSDVVSPRRGAPESQQPESLARERLTSTANAAPRYCLTLSYCSSTFAHRVATVVAARFAFSPHRSDSDTSHGQGRYHNERRTSGPRKGPGEVTTAPSWPSTRKIPLTARLRP
jgi:hypothetical protein